MTVVGWDMRHISHNETGTGVYATELLSALTAERGLQCVPLGARLPFRSGRSFAGRAARSALDIAWTHSMLPVVGAVKSLDAIHCPALFAPSRSTAPLVVTIHDVLFLRYPHHYARWWREYATWMLPRVLKSASHIITDSSASKRDLVNLCNADSEKVSVIGLGVNPAVFRPGPVSLDMLPKGIHGPGYILCVGAINERKNLEVVVVALSELRRLGIRCQIVLVGPTSPQAAAHIRLRRALEASGLLADAVFTGSISADQLATVYRAAGVLAFPSLFEGFGLPLVEAMASGVPVVAFRHSSVEEVVQRAGLLVQPFDNQRFTDAIATVLTCADLRRELVQLGLERATHFQWAATAARTAAIYRRATS